MRDRFRRGPSFIYVGKRDATTVRKFAEALKQLEMPADSIDSLCGRRSRQTRFLPARAKHNARACGRRRAREGSGASAISRQRRASSCARGQLFGHAFPSAGAGAETDSPHGFHGGIQRPRAAGFSPRARTSRSGRIASGFTSSAITPPSTKRARGGAGKIRARSRAPWRKRRSRCRNSCSRPGRPKCRSRRAASAATPASRRRISSRRSKRTCSWCRWRPNRERKQNSPRQSAWITDVIPCNLWIVR